MTLFLAQSKNQCHFAMHFLTVRSRARQSRGRVIERVKKKK